MTQHGCSKQVSLYELHRTWREATNPTCITNTIHIRTNKCAWCYMMHHSYPNNQLSDKFVDIKDSFFHTQNTVYLPLLKAPSDPGHSDSAVSWGGCWSSPHIWRHFRSKHHSGSAAMFCTAESFAFFFYVCKQKKRNRQSIHKNQY